MEHRRVVVVGGGLAGMAAGVLLGRAGLRVTLVEQALEVGGRARTLLRDGFRLNLGAHALYRGPGLALLETLGVNVQGARPRLSGGFALEGGRLHMLPTGGLSLLATGLLNLPEKAQAARFLSDLPALDTAGWHDRTFMEWLSSSGLRPGVARLVTALARLSTYADAPQEASAGATLDQMKLAASRGVLYVDAGWQTIVDQLRKAGEIAGVEFLPGAKATRVEGDQGGVLVSLEDGGTLRAASTVLAVPPETAASLGNARLPAETPVRAACLDVALLRLPRPSGTFALGIDRPLYLSVHSASARLAPEGAALVHLVHYLGSGVKASREEMEGLLERVQPSWRRQVVTARFLPEMTVSHALVRAARGGASGRVDVDGLGIPGVYLAGDWVGPAGMLADAALLSAQRAASFALEHIAGAAPAGEVA